MMNIVTWNMQGSNASTENKWNTQVATILNSNSKPDYVCLQESGPVPLSAELLDTKRVPDPTGGFTEVRYYAWKGTESRPGCGIVFHEWDVGGGRVNSAVVIRNIRWPAPPMELVWGGAHDWRPAVGVEVDGMWIFSYHAISPGGPDAPTVVAAVAGLAAPRGLPWVVAGDFNRQPPFAVPAGSAIREPGANTYSVQNPVSKYDYCVSTAVPGGNGDVIAAVVFSDHFPVLFQF